MVRRLAPYLLLALATAQSSTTDCSGRTDGLYGEDCAEVVTACHAGRALPVACPSGALFSAALGRCLQYANEAACKLGNLTIPAGHSAISQCASERDTLREGGVCSPAFEMCIEGQWHSLMCLSTFFFDGRAGNCTLKVDACMPAAELSERVQEAQAVCASHPEGFFALGCSTQFVACADGAPPAMMECPEEWIYDEENKRCEVREKVAACGAVEASGEGSGLEASGELQQEASGMEEGSGEQWIRLPAVEGSGLASGEASGEEEEGSGEQWIRLPIDQGSGLLSEWSGKRRLGEGLLEMDPSGEGSGEASGEASGEEGSGEASGEGSGEASGEGSGKGEEGSGEEGSGQEGSGAEGSGEGSGAEGSGAEGSGEVSSDSCDGRPDGFYGLGACSSQMLACTAGAGQRMPCPAGLVFDEGHQLCDFPGNVPGCGLAADAELPAEDALLSRGAPVDRTVACWREGAHAQKACMDWFTLCKEGRGLEMYCVQGYLFDDQRQRCVPATELAECKLN